MKALNPFLGATLLLLAGCATAGPPPERLAGCWIARHEGGVTRTMRWLPDTNRPGVLVGDMLVYETPPRNSRFTLEPRDESWVFCVQDGEGAPRCRQVAEGRHGSLEGGRVFIDAYGESLRISVAGDGPEQVIFRGQRDGCD